MEDRGMWYEIVRMWLKKLVFFRVSHQQILLRTVMDIYRFSVSVGVQDAHNQGEANWKPQSPNGKFV
jgi:hypothetical protein